MSTEKHALLRVIEAHNANDATGLPALTLCSRRWEGRECLVVEGTRHEIINILHVAIALHAGGLNDDDRVEIDIALANAEYRGGPWANMFFPDIYK